jgi:hypothetical protein
MKRAIQIYLSCFCLVGAFAFSGCGGGSDGGSGDATAGTEGTGTEGTTTVGEGCQSDADCEAFSENIGACRVPSCNEAGECVTANAENGTQCGTGDKCAAEPSCSDGECIGGLIAIDCNDNNPCTEDTCDSDSGCVNAEIEECCVDAATDCGEFGPCVALSCEENQCVTTPVEDCCTENEQCDDGNDCTADACTDFECVSTAIDGCCTENEQCDDGNDCTADACTDFECVSSPMLGCCKEKGDCDDKKACTEDLCNVTDGTCSNLVTEGCCVADSNCDDDDVCTTGSCVNNACVVDTIKSCCTDDAECEDANLCTTNSCKDNKCVSETEPGCKSCNKDKDCNDGDVCTDDSCDGGKCANADNGSCDKMIICEVTGNAGDMVDCPVLLAAKAGDDDRGVGLQFKAYPSGEATYVSSSCMDKDGNDTCANGKLPSGHAFNLIDKSDHLFVLIFDFTLNYLNDATLTSNGVSGNPEVVTFHFKLTANGTFKVEIKALVVSDKKGTALKFEFQDGTIITSKK